jgi:RND superfamily putative drug exporter
MVKRFAHLATRRPKAIVVLAVLVFLVAGATSGDVADHLTVGGFVDSSSEAARAEKALADQFGTGEPNVVLLVTARDGEVDDDDVAAAGTALTTKLAGEPGIGDVVSYWSLGNEPALRNRDGTRALVLARIESRDDDVVNERITQLAPEMRDESDEAVEVDVGGFAEVYRELGHTIEKDLLTAEMIALPITLVLLVLFFGSVAAGLLPLATAALSVVGTLLVLRLLTLVTDVSIYSLSLTTALGLGLAIDYSLFIVARYREELRRRPDDPRAAVAETVRSAGRTVAFSSLTVAASLSAMLLFPMTFLHSFAYAGVAVSLLAGFFSVLVLPAILALLGHKVNAGTLWKRSVVPPTQGVWHRVATLVMRRPLPVATGVIVVLLVLGSPFVDLHMTQPDERVLSEGSLSRQVHDIVRSEFSSTEEGTLQVVAPSTGDASDPDIDGYASELALLPGVARVDAATGTYCGTGMVEEFGCTAGDLLAGPETSERYAGFTADGGTYLSVVPAVAPLSDAGETLVHDVRDTPAPFDVLVSGPGAHLIDTNDSLLDRLPLALGVIAVVTMVLLFLMFGSVVLPVKAIVLNLLSLSATFGAMVWIFQDGHLSGLLDFTATGGISASMPIMMFCIAFGLSMDYEVFLLSRIKEEHDRGADNVTAVATGLERTGRIVTAAAVLMAVVFLAFVSSHVSFIKLYGVGLTLAVLLDAFVIRGTLVPAFMRLAGDWNWWAPAPLRRFYERHGIRDHGGSGEVEALPEETDGSNGSNGTDGAGEPEAAAVAAAGPNGSDADAVSVEDEDDHPPAPRSMVGT